MKTAFITFVRNFRKRKVIYSITIGGFGIALAVFVLIVSFVMEEKSYDKHLPGLEKMYRVKYSADGTGVPIRYYERLKEKVPEIENVGMYDANGFAFKYEGKEYFTSYLGINKECIDFFNIKFISGSQESVLEAKTGIAITKSFSKKIFGDTNPIGKEIEVNNEERIISAIVNDPPRTFSIKYDFLWHNDYNTSMSFWCYGKYPDDCYNILETAFLINENADIKNLEAKLIDVLGDCQVYKKNEITLQKYGDVYFDINVRWDGHEKANTQIIRLLSVVALIILILAILNYMNLSTAANKERFKEVCVRKTSGARNKSIILQFIYESYIACFIAFGLGLLLLLFIASPFNEIFGKEFNVFLSFENTKIIYTLVAIVILVGGLTGLAPAILASYSNPIQLIQKQGGTKSYGARGIFNSIQFVIAISLIICLILINKQIKYVKTTNFGFDTEQLLSFNLRDLDEHVGSIRDKLYDNPNIYQFCASEGSPFNLRGSGSTTVKADGKEYDSGHMRYLKTDWNFLKTYGVPIVLGRDFVKTDKEACLINENFFDEMAWENIENKFIGGEKVVGVFKDIHYEKLHTKIGKLRVSYEPNEAEHDEVSVRISSNDIPETIAYIKSVMQSFDPHFELYYEFYDELINRLYKQEEKQAKTIKIFALIAILLSCLGLYGMVEFSCTNRIKEIGIRKVNGAKIIEILSILTKEFLQWIGIAFIIAAPQSMYLIKKWLEAFAYKTPISWWVFALTGLITVFIALVTVSWQSWRAASRNPVEALRYE